MVDKVSSAKVQNFSSQAGRLFNWTSEREDFERPKTPRYVERRRP
jgi:hypothetical protein